MLRCSAGGACAIELPTQEDVSQENELTVTGGTFTYTDVWSIPRFYTGWAEGNGEVNANNNITKLTSVDQQTYFAGGYALEIDSDSNSNVHANNNNTTINDSTMTYVRSGYALDGAYAEAKENTLSMTGGEAYKMYAGQASITNYGDVDIQKKTYVWKNTLTLQNVAADYAYGGYSSALNSDEDDDISVSKKEAYASENTLIVNEGTSGQVFAGYAKSDSVAEATDNYVYLNYDLESQASLETKTTISGTVYGGYAEGTKAKATGNKGILVNATFSDDAGEFSGGVAVAAYNEGGEATASQNKFSITGGSLASVYGGQAVSSTKNSKAAADENVLTLSGAEVRATLYGGYAASTVSTETDADAVSGTASAKTNTLSLYGGTYGGDVYAGYASSTNNTAEAGSNTINLYALEGVSPSFAAATVIWGGYASQGGTEVASTGNNLTFTDVKGMTAANIKNFQNLTFSYTTTLATDDVVLNLTGGDAKETTTIADGTISVSVTALKGADDDPVFRKDDKVYLLKNDNENGLNITSELVLNTKTATTASVKTGGGTLECEIELKTDGNNLYLTRTDSEPDDDDDPGKDDDDPGKDDDDPGKDDDDPGKDDDNPDDGKDDNPDDGKDDNPDDGKKDDAIHAAPETKAIAEGALAGLALVSESAEAVFEVIDEIAEQDLFTFGTVHASNKTYESGSSISVSSVSLIAGLGKGFATPAGFLSVGAFFEYGKGSYTTHNDFSNRADIDGDGHSWYMGGGILGKMSFKDTGPGHFYVEGSAHMGTLHNEYDSNGLTDGYGNVAKFDMDSPYYSLHGALGYVWNMAEDHELKVYGKYIWTMVQGTDDTLTTGARFDFDDMHSNRVRGGVRYSYTGSERFKPYVGVAYEHEFAGSCDSRAFGYDVNSPSYKGGTGIGELGIAMTPTDALPLSFNLGVQGSVGKKRGVSGTCNVMYEF